jgi:acetoin utilization deacetylase AcuC-like enzyme
MLRFGVSPWQRATMGVMRVALVTHPSSLNHVAPWDHPERPERIAAAVEGVRASGVEIVEIEARSATRSELLAVHKEDYLGRIRQVSTDGGGALDSDTFVSRDSWTAALYAAGAGLTAVEAIERGRAEFAFAAVRPPGHHAEASRAMGFCLLNNVAVTAAALVQRGAKVAVVDWDAHHGNGTQDLFIGSPDVLYVSMHHAPFYPGTGRVEEVGGGLGTGTSVNIPLPAGSGGPSYRDAFARIVLPVIDQYGPDWLLVSAGYDGHADDPLGGMMLHASDYEAMSASLGVAMDHTNTVFLLEGGYNLNAIAESVTATINGFALGSVAIERSEDGDPWVDNAVAVDSLFWDLD